MSQQEETYRRGYRDGWIQAINAMQELMFERGVSRGKAHKTCWDHWEEALFEWQQRGRKESREEWPPRINHTSSHL